MRLPVEFSEIGTLRPRFASNAPRTALKFSSSFATIGAGAPPSRAAVSWDAKLNTHDAVARISKPTVRNWCGMNRCEIASTNDTSPPGFRITSTINASVFALKKLISASSWARALATLGGDIDGILISPMRLPFEVTYDPLKKNDPGGLGRGTKLAGSP